MINQTEDKITTLDNQIDEINKLKASDEEARVDNVIEIPSNPVETTVNILTTDHYIEVDEIIRKGSKKPKMNINRSKKEAPFAPQNFIVLMAGPNPEDYDSDPLDYEPGERSTFIIIVLAILFFMVLLTVGVMAAVILIEGLNNFVLSFSVVFVVVGVILSMTAYYGMACYAYGRTLPCNIIFLIMGTVGTIMWLCIIAAVHAPKVLLIAFGVTAFIVLICFILAFTGIDFTGFLMPVLIGFLALIVVSIVLAVVSYLLGIRLHLLQIILSILFAVAYSLMIVIELQMVLGGNMYEYGEDDYAFAAFTVYTSFVALFLRLLQLIYLIGEYFDLDLNNMG